MNDFIATPAILILAARDVPQAAEPVAGRPKEALAEVKVALTGPFCRPAPQARQPVVRKMRIAVATLPLAAKFYLIALIYCNSRMSCVCLASLVQVAHDRLYRVLYLACPFSRRLWEWLAAGLRTDGYLIIDDTVWRRFGKQLAGVSYVWDSSLSKKVLGMNIVLLLWRDGRRRLPVGLRIWRKGGKSKLNLAEEMLCQARRRGVTPSYSNFHISLPTARQR
jgi:hypothetical protein